MIIWSFPDGLGCNMDNRVLNNWPYDNCSLNGSWNNFIEEKCLWIRKGVRNFKPVCIFDNCPQYYLVKFIRARSPVMIQKVWDYGLEAVYTNLKKFSWKILLSVGLQTSVYFPLFWNLLLTGNLEVFLKFTESLVVVFIGVTIEHSRHTEVNQSTLFHLIMDIFVYYQSVPLWFQWILQAPGCKINNSRLKI